MTEPRGIILSVRSLSHTHIVPSSLSNLCVTSKSYFYVIIPQDLSRTHVTCGSRWIGCNVLLVQGDDQQTCAIFQGSGAGAKGNRKDTSSKAATACCHGDQYITPSNYWFTLRRGVIYVSIIYNCMSLDICDYILELDGPIFSVLFIVLMFLLVMSV